MIKVPEGPYPMMVTFDDIADPASVKLVDPENLAAIFGPRATLNSVTLGVTDEAVTEGRVERVLEWMPDYPETPIIPKVDPMDFSLGAPLRQVDFIRESN